MRLKKVKRIVTIVIIVLCLVAAAIMVTIVLGAHWSLAVFLAFTVYIVENLILALI